MKEIEIFYLGYCPYCKNARKAVAELLEENADYARLNIKWIDESLEAELADSRDYYSVPSLFWNGQKLYEAQSSHSYGEIKDNIRAAFQTVLEAG